LLKSIDKGEILLKVKKSPWAVLFPCPVVLISCKGFNGETNIITIAWVGTICSKPPMLSIGIRPKRYSYELIEQLGEFVVNIPTEKIVKEVDFCGIVSGRDVDKFVKAKFTQKPADKVRSPIIQECPVNIECIVKKKIPLGVHHLFIAEIVQVHIDEEVLNEEGRIDFTKISPFVYNQGEYWSLRKKIGVHGFSSP
jgi:flavin reductase (DIM6/NTAB) family NADH-FMN oxidoreductase RutF